MTQDNTNYMRTIMESMYLKEDSTLSGIGVDPANINQIHKFVGRLRHDVKFMPARNKAHLKAGLNSGDFAVSVLPNGQTGIVTTNDRGNGYNAAIFDKGELIARESGSLTTVMRFIPAGTYYVRAEDDEGQGSWSHSTHRSDKNRPDPNRTDLPEWDELRDKIADRVRDLAHDKLHDRIMKMKEEITATMEPGEDGFDTTDDFDNAVKLFRELAKIYKKPEAFEEHLLDAVEAAMAYQGGEFFGRDSDGKPTSYAGKTSRKRDSLGYIGGLHRMMYGSTPADMAKGELARQLNKKSYRDDNSKTLGQLENKIARLVLYYYENLGTSRSETPMYDPSKDD